MASLAPSVDGLRRLAQVQDPGLLVSLQGMPAHIWGLSAAERILGSSCAKLVPATTTVDGDDMCVFVVAG
jgi:hypothetical protein